MGLLFRILKKLYIIVTKIMKNSLIDDPYQNQVLVGIANLFTIIAIQCGFGLALYALVWAISLEILVKALIIAYFAALGWSKFCHLFTSFEQEMYLISSTVGYTVLIGAAIQIQRMPWADGQILFWYWLLLLVFGFIVWGITVHHTTGAESFKPKLGIKKIAYKRQFRVTKIETEAPPENEVQAYLKQIGYASSDRRKRKH